MPLFDVTVGTYTTATVSIEAENEDDAHDQAHEMIDELDFETDGSYDIEVEEV